MKSILISGDTLDFQTTVPGYPASAGWTLTYRLVPRASAGAAVSFDAATAGDAYRSQVAPGITAGWQAGEYAWSAYVHKPGARYTVDAGVCTIQADPATLAPGADTRSTARRIVEQLEAALATYTATSGHVAEYEINGRRMKFRDSGQIVAMLSQFRAEVWREDAAASMADGNPNPRNIRVRLARA